MAIEFGCGNLKKHKDAIGVDLIDYPDVDIVGDAFDVLSRLGSSSVDKIFAYHFIEHLNDFSMFMVEVDRILKPGGTAIFVAPHFSNPHFYSDPTHKNFFGLYTMGYYISETPFVRKVPTYGNNLNLKIESVELIFKSFRPYYLRHAFKKIHGYIFNLSIYMKEFYEEFFTGLVSCYEVKYVISKSLQSKIEQNR